MNFKDFMPGKLFIRCGMIEQVKSTGSDEKGNFIIISSGPWQVKIYEGSEELNFYKKFSS
jgi:hypothetical protein